ncbi:MAG: SRPBCC domain-containing protein [Chitinophagaceae bacterium]|nr:SRPBCC domain-containing protein [Chitinophagaceae bacterium]
MSDYNWAKFLLRISVDASVETIYHAVATQRGIESWFLRSAEYFSVDHTLRTDNEFIQRGDHYTWMWHGYDDETVEHNDILEANGEDMISFVFAGNCIVTITVGMLDTETIVQLVQENIPTGEESRVSIHIGCMEGWTFYLANLKSVLEGGIDLRNRNLNIGKVINS